jgi:hypothetical protein
MKQITPTWQRNRSVYRAAALLVLILWTTTSCTLALPVSAESGDPSTHREANTDRSRFSVLWLGETTFSEPELLAMIKDTDPAARQFAILRLGELEPPTDAAMDVLIQALGDKDDSVRFQALAGLMRLGRPATRVLVSALTDFEKVTSFQYDSEAMNGFRLLPISRSDLAFAALIHVQAVDIDALLNTYRTLGKHGSAEKPASPEMSKANKLSLEEEVRALLHERRVDSPQERIRMILDRAPVELTASLYTALQGDDDDLKVTVANMVGRAGATAIDTGVPLLAKAVAEEGEATVRNAAASALAQIPEYGAEVLYSLLSHPNPHARGAALAAYPLNARGSAQVVARLLKDPDPEVRLIAIERIRYPERAARRDYSYRQDICLNVIDGQSAPSLLIELPDTVLADVLALSNDADPRMREVAVAALGALGCARSDLASTIADTLAARTSDWADEVVSEAISQLAYLAKLRVVPRSTEALDRVLVRLADPPAGERLGQLLIILEHMELPDTRRKEIVEILVTACLADSYECEKVKAILSKRPGWSETAVEALVARYLNLKLFDDRAWKVLEVFDSAGVVHSKILEKFLYHPEKWLRASAAVRLAKRGKASKRVWDVLEEGVRSFEGYAGWAGEVSDALANLGEQGIERIIAIIKDSSTQPKTREALIYYTLSSVADKSSHAADILLATARRSADPKIQESAVWGLRSVKKTHTRSVRSALKSAFSTGNSKVRYAVVYTWKETGLAPGDLVERAFADSNPSVRGAAFELLPLLPKDDSRRFAITEAALRDENEEVRDKGLRFAGELAKAGAALLAKYAARGEPLTYSFFEGVERLDTLDNALVVALEARIASESVEVRSQITQALGRPNATELVDREHLYAQLEAHDAVDRENAAQSLLSRNEDPWAHGGLVAMVLMDAEVRKRVKERLGDALDLLYPPGMALMSGRLTALPNFPWPPPAGYSRVIVPRELFTNSGKATLGEVYGKLVNALNEASHGFEYGLFRGPPDGFALVARMERIKPDGTPFPEPARWMKKGSPKLSLPELLADLFFENSGYFRVIVFAATGNLLPGVDTGARLPEPLEGAPIIPRELAEKPFDDQEVLALIYSFERQHNAEITPWKGGAASAKQHLERAGVWASLTAVPSTLPNSMDSIRQ